MNFQQLAHQKLTIETKQTKPDGISKQKQCYHIQK